MNIFLPESPVIIAERTTWYNYGVASDGTIIDHDGYPVRFLEYCPVRYTLDGIREVFGIKSLNRRRIILPSGRLKITERIRGVESPVLDHDLKTYEVYKIKVYCWIFDLRFTRRNILKTTSNDKVSYYLQHETMMDNTTSIPIDKRYDFENTVEDMLFDLKTVTIFREKLSEQIKDTRYLYLLNVPTSKLSERGYI